MSDSINADDPVKREIERVHEARRMQDVPHPFESQNVFPWCAVCSLDRRAHSHV